MKKQIGARKRGWSILTTYWVHILFLFFVINYVVVRSVQLVFYASDCMSRSQIESDSRCLYSYDGQVYEKGSRSRPHHGHSCGSDVTTVMPSNHIRNMAKYLDPNLVGSVCVSGGSSPTPTHTMTPTPSPTPRPTTTHTPTPTIHQFAPTSSPTPSPRQTVSVSPTPMLSVTRTPTPTQVPVSTRTPTSTPTPVRVSPQVQHGGGSGFGKFVGDGRNVADESRPVAYQEITAPKVALASQPIEKPQAKVVSRIVLWSELLAAGSFILFLGTIVIGIWRTLSVRK